MKRLLKIGIAILPGVLAGMLFAEIPQWWVDRGIVDTNAVSNDYAPVNQGQVKHMAEQAREEFEINLPLGAGTNINLLVEGFTGNQNYVPANIGQLKYVAYPFYARLIRIGFLQEFPWGSSTNSADYAMANIGQLKNLFGFDLGIDSDADTLPDIWECEYFRNLNQTAPNDPDGDLLSNAEEYANGTNPSDSDTDDDYVQDARELAVASEMALDAAQNPELGVRAVYQAVNVDKSGATVDVLFDRPIDSDRAHHIANYSSDSVPIEPYRQPYVEYADLDNDGKLDLIIGRDRGDAIAYRNEGTRENPLFRGNPVVLADNVGFAWATDVIIEDMNGDGKKDLICGDLVGKIILIPRINAENIWPPEYGDHTYVTYNNGTEQIINLSNPYIGATGTASPLIYDIDNDGWDDLIVADPNIWQYTHSTGWWSRDGNILVYRNSGATHADGSPIYAEPVYLSNQDGFIFVDNSDFGTTKPSMYDLDGDGDDDLIISTSFGEITYFENKGTRDPVYNFPEYETRIWLGDENNNLLDFGTYAAVCVADYDNDSDADFLVGSEGLYQFVKGEITLIRNVGNPLFYDTDHFSSKYNQIPVMDEPQPVSVGWASKPVFWDMDHDGKVDMLSGEYQGLISLFINEDTGNGVDPKFLTRISVQADGTNLDVGDDASPSVVDFNEDGGADGLVIGNRTQLLFYRTDPVLATNGLPQFLLGDPVGPIDGVLDTYPTPPDPNTYYALPSPAIVDLNGDGCMDIVVARLGDPPNVLWYQNSASDHFALAAPIGIQANGVDISYGQTPALIDIDHDEDYDLFLGNSDGGVTFYENTGTPATPSFSAGVAVEADGQPINVGYKAAPTGFDYNGDGWMDLVIGDFGGNTLSAYNRVYLHNGQTEWSLSYQGKLGMEGSSPESAEWMGDSVPILRLTFPVITEVGSTIDLNDLFVNGARCSFANLVIKGDSDGDGLPNDWEEQYALNPRDALGDNGANGDPDGDGWSNLEELINGTNPKIADNGVLLYSTGFEPSPAENYVLGALNGQDNWTANEPVMVQNQVKLEEQAVGVNGFDVEISRQFTSSAEAVKNTFNFYFSSTGVFPPANLPETASTLLCFDPSRGLMAFDGDGSGNGEWELVPDSLLIDQWVEITVTLNYSRAEFSEKTWGVSIAGHGSLTGLGFKNNSVDKLNSIQIKGDAATPNYLDNLSIQKVSTVPW